MPAWILLSGYKTYVGLVVLALGHLLPAAGFTEAESLIPWGWGLLGIGGADKIRKRVKAGA